jgi:methylenetetrahydrofolate reductase (NADPH)
MTTLSSCLEHLYLEVFPVDGIEEQLLRLPDGAHLGITCSPKKGLDTTLRLVEQLQGHNFHLVPHIAARQVRDNFHLQDIIRQLEEQGVESMFVPGGDIKEPVGDFDSSLLLLRQMAEIGHKFQHVGVAAYPEGHPAIGEQALFDSLLAKQEFANYLVTQMCFDAGKVIIWLQQMRGRGIEMPAWIGLPGVMDRMKLFKTSLRIGVGESARFARKQTSLAGKLLRSSHFQPDELVHNLVPGIEDPALAINGFYLFSFNQVQSTIDWRESLLQQLGQSRCVGE